MSAINNPSRARQLIDFEGLQYENKLFTDIDAFQEYERLVYTFVEFKYGDAPLTQGQLRCQLSTCDDLTDFGKPSILILARHYVHDPKVPVDAASCIVEKYWLNHEWHEDGKRTVREVHRWFLGKYGHHGVKNESE